MVTDDLKELECEVCDNSLHIDPDDLSLSASEHIFKCETCGAVISLRVKPTYYTETLTQHTENTSEAKLRKEV